MKNLAVKAKKRHQQTQNKSFKIEFFDNASISNFVSSYM